MHAHFYITHYMHSISSLPGASHFVSLWKLTADRDWLFMSDLCCHWVCLCAVRVCVKIELRHGLRFYACFIGQPLLLSELGKEKRGD